MRKAKLIIFAILLLAGVSFAYQLAFYPQYWITGSVRYAADGTDSDGRQVYFYKSLDEYKLGIYARGTIGPAGMAGSPERYMINVFGLAISQLNVGEDYYVAIPNDNPENPAEGYGANPVTVSISGDGVDEAPELVLAMGADPLPPPPEPGEPAPTIKVWFGNRLYQPSIYGLIEEDKKPFVVPETGDLKIEVNIAEPFSVDPSASRTMSIQRPDGEVRTFDLSSVPGFKASAGGVRPYTIETPYPEELTALEEESVYILTFNAASSGDLGPASAVSTRAAVTVMGGPARLIGVPITYPSPVHLKTDKEVTFQYTLSRAANIDIYMFDISARVVKKLSYGKDQEGGSAGVNKVTWNLITDQGTLVGSGIYVFNLINRDDNKLLGKGKFTALP